MPVLGYETATRADYSWPARLICGLAIVNSLVAMGYVVAMRIEPSVGGPQSWADLPVCVCGCCLAVFATMGLFRVPKARIGMVISAIALVIVSWISQWVYLHLTGAADLSSIGYAIVGAIDNATVPTFIVLCLIREPIKGYFSSPKV